MKAKSKKGNLKASDGLPLAHARAAGIDIGDTKHFVAIVNDGQHAVREYGSFTVDLRQIVNDLRNAKITTVAMEATGVYWLQLYLMLEEAGLDPWLVNAKHVKNVTGRKKDDSDAIWIQKLHSYGLLQRCFQPEQEIRTLRTYVRHRRTLVESASDSVRRMQKSLELMNIKVHTVISDLQGKTGMAMIAAIVGGERNPEVLASYTDPRIKASKEDIVKSLEGHWKDENLFTLTQSYDEHAFYQKQLEECDKKIAQQLLMQVAKVNDGDVTILEDELKKKEFERTAYR
jgi:transposase